MTTNNPMMKNRVKPMITKCNNDPIKRSKDTTVLCHHNSKAGITYSITKYATTTNNIMTRRYANKPPFDELLLELKETSQSNIHMNGYNCFPDKGYRDFPISVPAERKQYNYSERYWNHSIGSCAISNGCSPGAATGDSFVLNVHLQDRLMLQGWEKDSNFPELYEKVRQEEMARDAGVIA